MTPGLRGGPLVERPWSSIPVRELTAYNFQIMKNRLVTRGFTIVGDMGIMPN